MRILIGTNTYKKYKRQDIAVRSYINLSEVYDCDVVDVQFKDATDQQSYDIDTRHILDRSSLDVTTGTKKLPFVNDILAYLSELRYDYFIFVNSDVILTRAIIKRIISEEPDCFACSRVDIQELDSFQQVIDRDVSPIRYEIAGFDAFVFNTEWFRDNKELFQDYLIGQPCWDQVYATHMRIHGQSLFSNKFPPCCFHVQHAPTWQVSTKTPERIFNHDSVESSYLDKLSFNIFDDYLKTHLIKRLPMGSFMKVLDAESSIESQYFNKFT